MSNREELKKAIKTILICGNIPTLFAQNLPKQEVQPPPPKTLTFKNLDGSSLTITSQGNKWGLDNLKIVVDWFCRFRKNGTSSTLQWWDAIERDKKDHWLEIIQETKDDIGIIELQVAKHIHPMSSKAEHTTSMVCNFYSFAYNWHKTEQATDEVLLWAKNRNAAALMSIGSIWHYRGDIVIVINIPDGQVEYQTLEYFCHKIAITEFVKLAKQVEVGHYAIHTPKTKDAPKLEGIIQKINLVPLDETMRGREVVLQLLNSKLNQTYNNVPLIGTYIKF